MADSPDPSPDCPSEIPDRLAGYDPDQLQAIATYAEDLAASKRAQDDDEDELNQDETTDVDEDLPDDVPSKATVVVKEINDNRYYYWQWREGDSIRSKYKGPVNPD